MIEIRIVNINKSEARDRFERLSKILVKGIIKHLSKDKHVDHTQNNKNLKKDDKPSE